MTAPVAAPTNYADFQGLDQLKRGARASDPKAIRETARQFESLFTHMMLKSMREASQGEGMGDSEDVKFYQDMFELKFLPASKMLAVKAQAAIILSSNCRR